jgi:membrane protein YqaA with SNARE-associated domain
LFDGGQLITWYIGHLLNKRRVPRREFGLIHRYRFWREHHLVRWYTPLATEAEPD